MTSPCSIVGISTMFMIAPLQSSRPPVSSGLVICFCTCRVLFRANVLDDIHVLSDWSFRKLLAPVRADRLEKDSLAPMASTTLLSECVTISDQGCSLRVIHVHVSEGIARVQTLKEGLGSGPRVPSILCLTGSFGSK